MHGYLLGTYNEMDAGQIQHASSMEKINAKEAIEGYSNKT